MRVEGYRGRLTAEHFDLMRIPRRFWGVSVSEIEPAARHSIAAYLRQLDEMLDRGIGMWLWGANGHGKTSAAVCVTKEVRRRGASVLMTSAVALIEAARSRARDDELVERAHGVDFLLVDDLGKEHHGESGFSDRFFEGLFRERSENRLTTWVTSNAKADALEVRYKRSMLEVIKEIMVPLKVDGVDWREVVQGKLREQLRVTVE